MLAIDSEQEERIGMGRLWMQRHGRRPLGEQEAYLARSLGLALGIPPGRGRRLTLTVDLLEIASTITAATGGLTVGERRFSDLSSKESVKALLEELAGLDLDQNIEVNPRQLAAAIAALAPNLCRSSDGGEWLGSCDSGPSDRTAECRGPGGSIAAALAPLIATLPSSATLNVGNLFDQVYPTIAEALVIREEFVFVDEVESPDGKWPIALGNVMVMELSELQRILVNQFGLITSALQAAGIVPTTEGCAGPSTWCVIF